MIKNFWCKAAPKPRLIRRSFRVESSLPLSEKNQSSPVSLSPPGLLDGLVQNEKVLVTPLGLSPRDLSFSPDARMVSSEMTVCLDINKHSSSFCASIPEPLDDKAVISPPPRFLKILFLAPIPSRFHPPPLLRSSTFLHPLRVKSPW